MDKAPRNANGNVEFSADMYILKPLDLTRGNGGLFVEANNRGNKQSHAFYNDVGVILNNDPTTAADLGNGFLLRQGYTMAWVGWQGNLKPGNDRLTAQLPIATDNGRPITELVIDEFVDARGTAEAVYTRPLGNFDNERGWPAVSTDQAVAMAELRVRPSDLPRPPAPNIPEGVVIPRSEWSFARCPAGPRTAETRFLAKVCRALCLR